MTAQEYLTELKRLLYPLSDDERKEAVAFYYESIADRIDEGLTEEEAVAEKTPNLTQPSFWTHLKHGHLTPFEWVGVVFSSVIWLPLAISVAAIFSMHMGTHRMYLDYRYSSSSGRSSKYSAHPVGCTNW